MLYIPSFVTLSQTVSKLWSGHDLYTENLKISKGNNSAKSVGGVTVVVNLCTSSDHAIYFYQVS